MAQWQCSASIGLKAGPLAKKIGRQLIYGERSDIVPHLFLSPARNPVRTQETTVQLRSHLLPAKNS
jgi:hypothetical protein